MSEVAIPGTFVDDTGFNEFNTSFDTDDPSISGNFENDYISSIEEITNFMNNTSCSPHNNEEVTPNEPSQNPSSVKLLTKANDNDGDKSPPEEKDKSNRKNKYYAPVYVAPKSRVVGTTPPPPEIKKREPRPSGGREKRTPKENGQVRAKEDSSRERAQPRQVAKRDVEPTIEIKKKDEDTRESMEYQQRKMEEMRRIHEQEQQERERRLREKEKERQDRDKLQASRIPGERATLYDLMTVQFSVSATFEPGEVVLVPRTRGGYSYGRVLQHFTVPHCYADSSVGHTSYHWRMVYPGPGGGNMFKDLPPAYIGKLVTTFNKDLVLPKDEDGERNIGDKPLGKDLNNAVFSPSSKFTPNQMVLVPRSKGGFTYGRIVKECTFTCRLDDSTKHEIPAWRVLVSGTTGDDATSKVRKDVLAGNIGKLYLPEQMQAAMQAASEAANLPTPTANTARRRISPEARDPFPSPSASALPTLTSAPYLPAAPALNYAQALQQGGNTTTSSVSLPTSPTVSTSPVLGVSTAMGFPVSSTAAGSESSDNLVDNKPESPPNGRVSPPSDPLARKVEESDGNTGPKPLRGVLELPEGMFPKAHKGNQRSRFNRTRENSSENLAEDANSKQTIVIDGPNVAMKHGNKKFSVKGISIAVNYYKSRGFDVVAFVPEYFATRKAPQHQLGSSTLKLGDFMNSVGGDEIPLLNSMVDQGLIVLTPPQDYDDSYSIEYARKHNCCIVTNDRYNDNIDKQPTEREKALTRKFIRDHSISFTFVRDEFMPNPDFKFPKE